MADSESLSNSRIEEQKVNKLKIVSVAAAVAAIIATAIALALSAGALV